MLELHSLLIVAIFVFSIAFLERVGYSSIAQSIYERFGALLGVSQLKKRRHMKEQLISKKREIDSVSAMDEFSKWAKLRRQHDKLSAEYDKFSTQQALGKTTFEVKTGLFLRVVIVLLHLGLLYAYAGKALIYVPDEWFSPLSWILSMPFGPSGSIGVHWWLFVCRAFSKQILE